ncbi:MAG: C40 family peptidase [Acidaminococcaceae bacterium]|nr:C40 family peptidase [Acidaminococcaceae bacterium]
MDFSSYKAESKLGAPADRTSNVKISNPGAAALANEQAKTGAIFLNGLDRLRAEVQTGRVMQANNEYNKELLDLTNELRQNKEQDALDTVQQFDEREQKIRSRIQKKYGSFLYGEAGRKYDDMLIRDYNSRRQSMINYQIGEAEKFNDTVLKNGLNDVANLATSDYMNPDNVNGAMNKAAYLVAQRYEHYGEEKIKQMTRAAQGNLAAQVIDRAYANGDTGAAETFIEKYGSVMEPNVLTGYAKNVYASRMAMLQETTAKSLFARFGDDEEAAYRFINSEEFGGTGNVNNALAWYKDAEAQGKSLGKNQCTVGLNYALQAGGCKPINTWAPTAWEEAKNAGKTFTDQSRLRVGDIVYWNTSDIKGEASHVGMYVGNGKVCQSGDSGIRTIPLSEYTVVGFQHPEGRAATPEERKKLFTAYQQEKALRKRFETQARQQVTDAAEAEFFQMYKDGNADPSAYHAKAIEYAGDDPKLFKSIVSLGNSFASISGKVSGNKGNTKSDPLFESSMVKMMTAGGYSNADVLAYIDNPENMVSDADKAKTMKLIEQRNQGKGPFAYNWEGIKDKVMEGYQKKDKAYVWGNVHSKLIYDIDKYRREHANQDPARDEVVRMGLAALADSYSYTVPGTWLRESKEKVSSADLAAVGIMDIYRNPNGLNDIFLRDGRQRRITDAQLQRILAGEPVTMVVMEE